ncbi:folylpolyglutamate synthase, mitochondrial-like, partial [Neolamprologus brichardi]|uniref:folylpolyglutamate synthase, mitochondrial-like n=1 Tax=Neolamprologus brichardi TaxID=32507 RepID=UPI001643DDCB
MMLCMSLMLRRGSAFAARLARRDRALSLAGLSCRHYSTETAPHIPGMEYQDAICTLNTLQTNASALEQVRRERSNPQLQLNAMRGFLERAGLTVDELNHLNIIHVTGTKGKKYFWQVYGRLDETKDAHGGTMPAYFRFLTILAFHVFLQEKVDLAVIEVGIGGAYDCTNIIRTNRTTVKPTRKQSLNLSDEDCAQPQSEDEDDMIPHQCQQRAKPLTQKPLSRRKLLILWNQRTPGVPAFTVRQPEGAMPVLEERAKEIGCPLWVCPQLEDYQVDCGPLHLGLAGQHQRSNASLALQLSHTWLQRRCLPDHSFPVTTVENNGTLQAPAFSPSPIMVKGLADAKWPGRTQTLKHEEVTYFLDGAHTMRSMQACVQWFRETAAEHERSASGAVARVLLFNATGERDSAAMLKLLVTCHFDFAVFCPNITEAIASCNADQQNFNVSVENMLTRCLDNERSWCLHNRLGDDEGTQLLIQDS